jgi:tetraacyldisaccharide-1-P 4'-kinase
MTDPPSRSPWQRLYGGVHELRGRWYRDRARRLPRPVISVGNLHWGGGGKTPLVAAVARHLHDGGAAVCILSRGYGRRGGGVRVVSSGDGPLLPPEEAGDEPVLLASELPGVAVVVGGDRHRAGSEALACLRPAPDLFLLDDGFSHLALHRDLDLLAFPAADPFGGGRLWPGGRLREPLAATARADAVLLTGAPEEEAEAGWTGDASPPAEASREAAAGPPAGAGRPPGSPAGAAATGIGPALAAALRPYGFAGPGFASATRPGGPRLLPAASATGTADSRLVLAGGGAAAPLPAGSRVLLVSAIARPERFAAAAQALDFAVMGELRFPDHHRYPAASLARIEAKMAACGAEVALVTSKDRVKLQGRLRAPLAELPVAAVPEAAFWAWLDGAVSRLSAGGATL